MSRPVLGTPQRAALWLGVLALLLRLLYLYEAADSLFFEVPVVDAKSYVDGALELSSSSWLGPSRPFWQPPLYPYILGLIYSICGPGVWAPHLLQALVGAGICALLYLIAYRVFPPSVALGAALAATVYGPLIYFGGELLPTLLGIGLDLLLVYVLLGRMSDKELTPKRWLLAGVLLGLSALAVANALLFLPMSLLWLAWTHHRAGTETRRILLNGGLLLLGSGLIIAPVTARNYFVGADWVLISSNAGVNFYIGNNPDYEQTVNIRPGQQWSELVEMPERVAGIETASAKARFFFAQSFEFARREPVAFLGLTLRKFYLFWRGDEIRRNLDLYWARQDSLLLSALLWQGLGLAFPFGLVGPLALFGWFSFWRQPAGGTPQGRLLALLPLVYMLSVVLFFVTSRYRLPAVPFLLLFAAYGVHSIRHSNRRFRSLAVVIVLGVICNIGAAPVAAEADTQQHFWQGYAYEKKAMPINAMEEYRRVLHRESDHRGALLALAQLHNRQQEHDEAARLYESYLREHSEADPVRYLLGTTYLQTKRYAKAIGVYEALLLSRPDWARLHGELAYAYLMDGRREQALGAYRRTLEIRPDSSVVRYQLARLYESLGDRATATAELRHLVQQAPQQAEYRIHLANLLVQQETAPAEAEDLLREAVELEPKSAAAHWGLGLLLARQQRYEPALPHFERLLVLESDIALVHRCLGNLYQRLGRQQDSAQHFQRAAQITREGEVRRVAEAQIRSQVEQLMGSAAP